MRKDTKQRKQYGYQGNEVSQSPIPFGGAGGCIIRFISRLKEEYHEYGKRGKNVYHFGRKSVMESVMQVPISLGHLLHLLLIFCTDTLGISAAVVETLLMISKVLDGISDVLWEEFIDATHSKMGSFFHEEDYTYKRNPFHGRGKIWTKL